MVVSKLVLSLIYQTNEMIETVKTDLEVANEALVGLNPNITASDKKEAPYTRPTVDLYLKGYGRKLEVAMDLLAFFRSRIDGRRSLISQTEHNTAA